MYIPHSRNVYDIATKCFANISIVYIGPHVLTLEENGIAYPDTYLCACHSVVMVTSLPTDTPVDPYPIRLMGGQNSSEGRVEIFYNGEWGTICDRDWDMDDADVACRSLGFPGAAAAPTGVCDIIVTINAVAIVICCYLTVCLWWW